MVTNILQKIEDKTGYFIEIASCENNVSLTDHNNKIINLNFLEFEKIEHKKQIGHRRNKKTLKILKNKMIRSYFGIYHEYYHAKRRYNLKQGKNYNIYNKRLRDYEHIQYDNKKILYYDDIYEEKLADTFARRMIKKYYKELLDKE